MVALACFGVCANMSVVCVDAAAQGLSRLRVLDVGGNQLRRVEVLAACRGLSLMTSLNVAGNPVEAAQNARFHMVHLLTQVCNPRSCKLAPGVAKQHLQVPLRPLQHHARHNGSLLHLELHSAVK